jgi:hypothetical protein
MQPEWLAAKEPAARERAARLQQVDEPKPAHRCQTLTNCKEVHKDDYEGKGQGQLPFVVPHTAQHILQGGASGASGDTYGGSSRQRPVGSPQAQQGKTQQKKTWSGAPLSHNPYSGGIDLQKTRLTCSVTLRDTASSKWNEKKKGELALPSSVNSVYSSWYCTRVSLTKHRTAAVPRLSLRASTCRFNTAATGPRGGAGVALRPLQNGANAHKHAHTHARGSRQAWAGRTSTG